MFHGEGHIVFHGVPLAGVEHIEISRDGVAAARERFGAGSSLLAGAVEATIEMQVAPEAFDAWFDAVQRDTRPRPDVAVMSPAAWAAVRRAGRPS